MQSRAKLMCPLSSRQGAHYCGGVIRIFCNAIVSYWTVGDTDPYKKNKFHMRAGFYVMALSFVREIFTFATCFPSY